VKFLDALRKRPARKGRLAAVRQQNVVEPESIKERKHDEPVVAGGATLRWVSEQRVRGLSVAPSRDAEVSETVWRGTRRAEGALRGHDLLCTSRAARID
jgi:hypothetical protein